MNQRGEVLLIVLLVLAVAMGYGIAKVEQEREMCSPNHGGICPLGSSQP